MISALLECIPSMCLQSCLKLVQVGGLGSWGQRFSKSQEKAADRIVDRHHTACTLIHGAFPRDIIHYVFSSSQMIWMPLILSVSTLNSVRLRQWRLEIQQCIYKYIDLYAHLSVFMSLWYLLQCCGEPQLFVPVKFLLFCV